ncbi:DUF2997 domain-containing protein [Clostridium estertheticum]|uniref:DUF2997 domain-containing protein n=1 Tax=Clostridium estertheticum TaxID=238834 RepID=UPI001C7D2632|nr:DUF2997 domain-containing protein [Clostridium estertheticum]MBX4262351.1 DUF2997 domain-containing protein [Clostridium estertheticum]WLC71638.1 DUF2997 domain-containing protein [Clostridium estertheticum]
MSHCSTFDIYFRDKKVLYKALRNLNMSPENRIWEEYKNLFSKKIGIGGTIIGRLLTGRYNNINIFFIEKDENFIPYFESHKLTEEALNEYSAEISLIIQREYLKCTVNKLADKINSLGGNARVAEDSNEDSYSVTLIMDEGSKTLSLNLDRYGLVNESVVGVVGRSCVDLSKKIESAVGVNIHREWTYEYDTLIEDKLIQVLKINNL